MASRSTKKQRKKYIPPLSVMLGSLHYGSIFDDCILVDDNNAVMDGVHCEIPFLARNIVDADSASIPDTGILIDDGLADDRAPADAYIRYSLFGIGCLFGFGLIVGCSHAIHTVQRGS